LENFKSFSWKFEFSPDLEKSGHPKKNVNIFHSRHAFLKNSIHQISINFLMKIREKKIGKLGLKNKLNFKSQEKLFRGKFCKLNVAEKIYSFCNCGVWNARIFFLEFYVSFLNINFPRLFFMFPNKIPQEFFKENFKFKLISSKSESCGSIHSSWSPFIIQKARNI
jgi:hypothetical protein